jgi:hypothetical protein
MAITGRDSSAAPPGVATLARHVLPAERGEGTEESDHAIRAVHADCDRCHHDPLAPPPPLLPPPPEKLLDEELDEDDEE